MKTIKFNAHRGQATISKLIRFFSRGIYNHISIEINGFIYEAHIKGGVLKTSIDKWNDDTVHDTKTLNVDDVAFGKVLSFLEAQVGKKYDIRGILAFLFVVLKPRQGYWFCSELAIVALSKALGKIERLNNQTISPSMFWDILSLVV